MGDLDKTETIVTTKDLIQALASKAGVTLAEARGIVDTVLESVAEGLARGEEISLNGLGKFRRKDVAARRGRNPATGQAIEIAASRKVTFTASKALKERL